MINHKKTRDIIRSSASVTLPQRDLRHLRWNRCIEIVIWFSNQSVRGLDILQLHLFVLHNTDTISFPLCSSRFLRYNKQKTDVSSVFMTTEITLLYPHPPRSPSPHSHMYTGASVIATSITHVHRCIGYRNPVWHIIPTSVRLMYLSVNDIRVSFTPSPLPSPLTTSPTTPSVREVSISSIFISVFVLIRPTPSTSSPPRLRFIR